jgi:hypothetical protein
MVPTPNTLAARMGCAALATAALTALAAVMPARAEVISFSTPIALPTTSGLYINFATGAVGGSFNSTGADFYPYISNGQLAFSWPSSAQLGTHGGVATAPTAGSYLSLPLGAVISSASAFSATASSFAATAFHVAGTHYLGFRFFNEATQAVNYGYLTLSTTSPNGSPGAILGWSFEDSGGPITVVPEPGSAALWCLGLLGLGLRCGRRHRRFTGLGTMRLPPRISP